MAFESLELLAHLGGAEPDATGLALARAEAQGHLEDARAEREAEARRAAHEDRAEHLAMLDRSLGGAMQQVRSHQADMTGLQERVEDLRAQLSKAEARLDSCRASLTWWSERLMLAEETSARSAVPSALEQAQLRAQDVLRQAHENRDILQRARRSVRHGR